MIVNVNGEWYNTLEDYECLKEIIEGKPQGINPLFGYSVNEINQYIRDNNIQTIALPYDRALCAKIAETINDLANKTKPDELNLCERIDDENISKVACLVKQKLKELFAITLAASGYQLEEIDKNDVDYLSDICKNRVSRIVKL